MTENSKEEIVVDNFISEYDEYLKNWEKGLKYYSPENLPDNIKNIINFLSKNYLVQTRNIKHWQSVEEFPESLENLNIIYSIVNLLINNIDSFIPNGIKEFIIEYKDKHFRKALLKSIYYKTYNNILKLNTSLNELTTPVSETVTPLPTAARLVIPDPSPMKAPAITVPTTSRGALGMVLPIPTDDPAATIKSPTTCPPTLKSVLIATVPALRLMLFGLVRFGVPEESSRLIFFTPKFLSAINLFRFFMYLSLTQKESFYIYPFCYKFLISCKWII